MTAPLPENEQERLEALTRYQILDTPPEDVYDDIARLAAHFCETPIAAITFLDAERQWFKSTVGVEVQETGREIAFCAHTILQRGLLVVPDARRDSRFVDNPFVTGEPYVRFYASVPLINAEGYALGSLCVADTQPRTLSAEQQDALQTLARQAMAQLELAHGTQEQKRSDETLHLLGVAFSNADEGITVADVRLPDCPLNYCNAAFLSMTGYAEPEVLGRNCRFLQGPETDRESVRQVHDAIQAGQPCRITLLNYRKDGTSFWNELSLVPVRDEAGALTHFIGLQHDVTFVKDAENALEESRARVADILESITDGFFAVDREWRFTYVNDQAEQLLQRPRGELLGQNGWNEFPLAVETGFDRELHQAMDQQETVRFEEFYLGLNKWFEMQAYPSNAGLSVYFRDVTERKKAEGERQAAEVILRENEQRLSLALESGRLGTWDLDLRTEEYTAVSALTGAILGMPPGTPLTRADLLKIIHPDDRALVQTMREAASLSRTYELEHRVVWADGSIHWVHVLGSKIFDGSGQPVRVIGTIQDVTERKAQEEQREQALREAERRADRDPLTDLLNHRAFHSRLKEEAARVQRENMTLAVVMLDLDNFRFFNDVYGHTTGDEVLRLTAEKLQSVSRPGEVLARFGGDEFALLMPNVGAATAEEVETRLREDLDGFFYRIAGQEATIPLTVSLGAALFPAQNVNRHQLLRQAEERLRWSKTGGGIEAEAQHVRDSAQNHVQGFSMMDALVTAVDNKDRYTRKHSEDVLHYCILIAQELGMDETLQQTIRVAALLHDVGKIGVPDAILRKPGTLTDDEFEAVKQHPMMGALIVGAVPGLEDTLDAVRHHHERWDGGGYPFGLRGAETPLMARLMAVADAYSAMTTDRPYRQGMPPEKALGILQSGAGTQWDAACVAAFVTRMQAA